MSAQVHQDLLDRCSRTNAKSVHTLMLYSFTLSEDGSDRFADPTEYISLASGLQYLVLTWPDIAYAVNSVSIHACTYYSLYGSLEMYLEVLTWHY
ncbi:hypothetical protein PVK06_017355 [Gossypium arboreum]|uniref:Uncharacterized protein n=1 Tax=Gossypium arboreum TaxID=29729 RepID=A0ABR0Q388_GOSAR|nr:hypothetical protein PVK06_017355 [Gossypium arboreum]